MDGIGRDDSISILRLFPLQRDRGVGGDIDAGSWLANRLYLGKYRIIKKSVCT